MTSRSTPPRRAMAMKPFKPIVLWAAIHPSGLPSCLLYTDEEMCRKRREDKCLIKCGAKETYWRYIRVRITQVRRG